MKKLLLIAILLCACGSVGSSVHDLWVGNVRLPANTPIQCYTLSSITFELIIRNSLNKEVCATVITNVPVGFIGTQEVNVDSVYSCSSFPGNKEILYIVDMNGIDLPLSINSDQFYDYPNANHLYLSVDTNTWNECIGSNRFVDLNANWILTR